MLMDSISMLGLAFIKRISGLNKKTKKVPHVFF